MSEYHYNYSQSGPGRNGRNGGSFIEMLLDMVLSVIMVIPSLIATVMGKVASALSEDRAARPGPSQATGQTAGGSAPNSNLHKVQRPSASAPASPQPEKKPETPEVKRGVKATAGRGLMVLGSVLTGLFGLPLLILALVDAPTVALAPVGVFAGIGVLTLWGGLRRRKKARLYLKYLGLIGRRQSVSLTTLAKAAGRSHKKVCRELQDMLDQGILPAGYLDLAADQLVLSAQGIADKPAQEPARPKPEDENDILRQIREVNDSIPDPVMSAKIDRIGEITGKILDYQRKNPGKASQLRSFLNYYLPTTLKILRAYAQLDKQGVEGKNISAAKQRIEGMMDKVVEGFEKQLDRLFQDDALDITSDVAVLEQMLDKDGLGDQGFTLEL